jgi:hypothetical protein
MWTLDGLGFATADTSALTAAVSLGFATGNIICGAGQQAF